MKPLTSGKTVQFTRKEFVFSRLKPYEEWAPFEAEATRLWKIYVQLAKPAEVQRLGVRFINAISPVQFTKVGSVSTIPPKSPSKMKLPVSGFMHQTEFEILGHPYKINVVQTIVIQLLQFSACKN